jgi:predicted hotdog family 3-hydroxylacyl-ACP dehydratase
MIEKDELLTLIPHRGKMMMLDRVKKYDIQEKSIEAEYCITEDCLFYNEEEKGVPAWVGFEFIAQAISAFIGIRDREKGMPPLEGYILGISQMNIGLTFISKNSIITIASRELDSMHPVYIFEGEILLDGHEVLSGKITVMEVNEEQKS